MRLSGDFETLKGILPEVDSQYGKIYSCSLSLKDLPQVLLRKVTIFRVINQEPSKDGKWFLLLETIKRLWYHAGP
jgi:hypothetical protein